MTHMYVIYQRGRLVERDRVGLRDREIIRLLCQNTTTYIHEYIVMIKPELTLIDPRFDRSIQNCDELRGQMSLYLHLLNNNTVKRRIALLCLHKT